MIRQASVDDLPALLDLAERCITRGGLPCGMNRDTMAQTLSHLITDPNGIVFVTDSVDGAAGGLVHPHPFNADHITGQELFWWAEGGGGAELFAALEGRAKDLGCHSWMMVALESMRPAAVGALYRRRGYSPVEHSYMKVF
jgi:hypothetical protein